MNFPKLAVMIFCLSHLMMAQQQKADLSAFSQRSIPQSPAGVANIKLLAVLVQFQPDNDRTTIGNGQFDSIYTQNWGTDILDPLPHDSAYFAAHLKFAKNYYERVSSGNVTVKYTVVPEIITLSKTMREYSPPIRSTDFSSMINFFEETWQMADQQNPGINFADYNLFCVFHAGVGRDVSLPGSLGNERDIPSVYIGLPTLQQYKGSSYGGVPVNNGSFNINNSMILPQTQNREYDSFTGKFLIELTINGLLVSSIGSHLGLPDLFDTQTGLSAIGRFGLMDGQSIFAYNGVLPPEPSAWEKKHLGWVTPVKVDALVSAQKLGIKTSYNSAASDTTIIKIPLSGDEYYLVENRIQNPNNNGLSLTIWNQGQTYQKNFAKDTSWFNSYTVDSLEGVIIDASHFDWALPGSGILVWHIDEKVIRDNIASNKINTVMSRRGVDLEEADGIQDIGVQFTTIFGDVLVGEGDYLDLWYSGNEADLYTNEFSARTRPDTRSNNGANSWVKFSDFSPINLNASFTLQQNSPGVKILKDDETFPAGAGYYKSFTVNGDTVSVAEFDDSVMINYVNKYTIPKLSQSPLYFTKGNELYVIDYKDSLLNTSVITSSAKFSSTLNLGDMITSPAAKISASEADSVVLIGTKSGKIIALTIAANGTAAVSAVTQHSAGLVYKVIPTISGILNLSYNGSQYSLLVDHAAYNTGLVKINYAAPVFYGNNLKEIYLHFEDGNIVVLENISGSFTQVSNFYLGKNVSFAPSLGSRGLSSVAGITGGVTAKNISGSTEQNFPVTFSDGNVYSNIVSADITSDGYADFFFINNIGQLSGIDGKSGQEISGFPVAYSTGDSVALSMVARNTKLVISAVSKRGRLTEWEAGTGTIQNIFWADARGLAAGNSYFALPERQAAGSENLDKNLTYNYPNPVYEGSTYIRYYVKEDSRISIRIFDLAGELAAELNSSARAGVESETKWDVSAIQSGVYLARIEAVSASGKTESKIIKIAVVK